MKKLLLHFILISLPFIAAAQNELFWYKDFADKVSGIADVTKVNDHLQLMTLNIDQKTSEVVAIDDKMKVLWRTTIQGYAIASGAFKGHILSIAASRGTDDFGFESPYLAFLLDEQTGKLQAQKAILNTRSEGQETPILWFGGSDFKLLIRQSNATKSAIQFPKHFEETRDLSLVNLNENLDAAVVKPTIPSDPCLTTTFSNNGDILMLTVQPASFSILKYEAGKTDPSASIVQQLNYVGKFSLPALLIGSTTDKNVCYFSVGHQNADKQMEITIGKSNFATHSSQTTTELFDKQRIKSFEKNYARFNKLLDAPIFGYLPGMTPIHMEEVNGGLIVAIAEKYLDGSRLDVQSPIIISSYDMDLKQKFQQILPTYCYRGNDTDPQYNVQNNVLNIVADNSGTFKRTTLLASLDLKTGNWLKIEKLSADNNRQAKLSGTFWWKDSFLVPYDVHHGVHVSQSCNIELQQNPY